MVAALRILRDVAWFRLRRLEMANLVAAGSLVVVLRLEPADAALRLVAASLLNLLAYLINDHCDVAHDLAIGREPDKTRFLAEHRGAALFAELSLTAALVVLALLHDPTMLAAIVAGAGLCWWYSASLKHRPFVDVAAMAAWGVAMPLVAVPWDRGVGWGLVAVLGIYSAVFETIQVLRDRTEDEAEGLRTTAVVLGERTTLGLARCLGAAAGLFSLLVLGRWAGALALFAVLVPWTPGDAARYWTRIRLVLGVAWLALLVEVWFRG